jgi:uncharacterized damage-inducible protein DinB
MDNNDSTLDVIFDNWQQYNGRLMAAVAKLTDEQLELQPARGMWPLGQIIQHIISVRAGWFSGTLQDPDEAMTAYMEWGQRESPPRNAAELARGLEATWAFIEERLRRWTPEERAMTFPEDWDGEIYQVARNWVIYHVLEHDLCHGGELSLLLGMNGLRGVEI